MPSSTSDIVFATHRHPDLSAVRCKERFVRRAPDVGYVLYSVSRSIDESDGIRANRDDIEGAAIGRKTQPVHQQLALIKRTETGRRLVTEMDAAEELVVRWIGNRDSVRILVRRVNAVAMSDRYFGGVNSERCLARASIAPTDKNCRGEQNSHNRSAFHITLPCSRRKTGGIWSVLPSRRHLVRCWRRRRQRLAKRQPHCNNLLLLGHYDFLA